MSAAVARPPYRGNPRLGDWRGRSVWIVGASSGIGEALARRLHALGARVVVSGRRVERLDALARDCPGVHAVPLDATQLDRLDSAVAVVMQTHTPELVVYSAGHYRPTTAKDLDANEWNRHRDVNLDAPVRLSLAVLPYFRAQGHGHLSLVSSVAGYRGLPLSLAYGTTKAALTHFGEALHLELAPQGLGVSVIAPGFVDTPMTAGNRFHMPALIAPAVAAEAIVRAWGQGRFLIAPPRRFTLWMGALRILPHSLYFRLVHRSTRP